MLFGHLIRMDEPADARRIFWLQFPRVIGEGQLDDPTPPGWPLWRTTYLCTTSPTRMLSKWPWISRCGDYWQQAELRTDGACRIMMMMTHYWQKFGKNPLIHTNRRHNNTMLLAPPDNDNLRHNHVHSKNGLLSAAFSTEIFKQQHKWCTENFTKRD